MLGRYVQCLWGDDSDRSTPSDVRDISLRFKHCPAIDLTHDDASDTRHGLLSAPSLGRDKQSYRRAGVVLLVRDPCDVVVSYFYQLAHRERRYHCNLSQFIRDPQVGLLKIITFYNHWAAAASTPHAFHLVRYEDLHASPEQELARIVRFFGLPVDTNALSEAVSYAHFSQMRSMERAGVLPGGQAHQHAREANAAKVRRGKVGAYREEMGVADQAWCHNMVDAYLSDAFVGYKNR